MKKKRSFQRSCSGRVTSLVSNRGLSMSKMDATLLRAAFYGSANDPALSAEPISALVIPPKPWISPPPCEGAGVTNNELPSMSQR